MKTEVVDMTHTQHTTGMDPGMDAGMDAGMVAGQGRSVQGISQLFDIASRESEVIAGLAGGMDQLRAVQAAKHALAKLTPAEVRAALAYRRTRQPGPAGQPGAERPAGEQS